MACAKTAPAATPIPEPTLASTVADASTKPFAVNPEPNPARGVTVLAEHLPVVSANTRQPYRQHVAFGIAGQSVNW